MKSKIAAYLGIKAEDMYNGFISIQRSGTTSLVFDYTFSTRPLIGHYCNVSAIISLRDKLVGSAAEANFKQILLPQFSVISMSNESYQQQCNELSSEAPNVGSALGSKVIKLGQYFSFTISTSIFLSPAGSSMRLKIYLRFTNNTAVPTNYWIGLSGEYLDQNIKIRGLASLSVFNKQSSYNFRLVAVTPLLAETSINTFFRVEKSFSSLLVTVTMTQQPSSAIESSAFANSFTTFISTYLGVNSSTVILLNVNSNSVVWTLNNLSEEPCNFTAVNALKEKLLDNDGNMDSSLKAGLSAATVFSPSAAVINLNGSCNPPKIGSKIPILHIPKYDSLRYNVQKDVFTGGSNPENLKITLLDSSGNDLPLDSWVWYNNITRMISGFPASVTVQRNFSYLLRARDAYGSFVDQNVSIILNWTAPAFTLSYQIRFKYDASMLPYANLMTVFLQKIKTYFKQSSQSNIILFQPAFLSENRVILYYQNTSLYTSSCDINGNNAIINRLKTSPYGSVPNAGFTEAMKPEFTITKVQEFTYGVCLVLNRKPPYFNFFNPIAYKFAASIKDVSFCSANAYLVPEELFRDEEEGGTRNLQLRLDDNNKQPLPNTSWLNINATSQTIYAVADDQAYTELTGLTYKLYRLVATDSDGKSDYAPLKFRINTSVPAGHYNVTMQLEISEINNEPYPLQLSHLFKRFKKLFTNGLTVHIRSYSFKDASNPKVATVVWSPCNMPTGFCNLSTVAEIRSKIFKSGTTEMNPDLNQIFQGVFSVLSVSESLGDECDANPPTVSLQLPVLYVGFCGVLTYKIPEKTFIDEQDGTTSQLKLRLVYINGTAVLDGNWLHLDSKVQTIKAVLTEEQAASGFPKLHKFVLVATDSSGLSTNTTIRVHINGTASRYSHSYTVQTTYSTDTSNGLLYLFATRINAYFGDKGPTFQAIKITEAFGKKLIITWCNCTLRYDPCDVIPITRIRSKLQVQDGSLKSEFVQTMQPEFRQMFLSETNNGPCQSDQPPKLALPFGPISVTTCQTYKARIPEGTFTDREQGTTRNLDLSLKTDDYDWIYFDTEKQEIKVLVTNQIATNILSRSVAITLVAKDLYLQQAEQEITINITPISQTATHNISMEYRITALPKDERFVTLYDIMRQSITKYFSSANDLLTSVEYIALPTSLAVNTVLTATWCSCSLRRDACDRNAIARITNMLTANSVVTTAFKSALQSNFLISKVTVRLEGRCRDDASPPVVKNPLPIIQISYCGYTEFQVPANTFFDSIDGGTRNLTLSLQTTAGRPVTEKWIEFDAKKQTFLIVLADNSIPILPTPRTILFVLNATTKRGMSVTENVRLRLSQQYPNASFIIKLNFAWIAPNPPSRNNILKAMTTRLANYLGGEPNDMRLAEAKQEPESSYPYFVLKMANCSARYSPCDRVALNAIVPKIQNKDGPVPAFTSAVGGNEAYLTYVQVTELGPCLTKNTPPTVLSPLNKIQVQTCSDFNYTLPSNTFRDEEDSILQLSITKVDGIPISGNYRWVRIVSNDHTLFGVVTDKLITEQPSSGYNLTIRATDSGGLFVETFLVVQIVGERPQDLYQFTLELSANSIGEQFMEEREVTRILNSYFKAKFTNILSYTRSSSNRITLKSSICILSKKCDESAASAYFHKISTAQKTMPAELQSHFAYRYTIISSTVHKAAVCQQPLNPPVPAVNTWTISASYCGGFNMLVPSIMFNDPEDGNTRQLSLEIYLANRTKLPADYWLQINKTTQVIYGWPTRSVALSYSTDNVINLVATDKTGQEGSISIKFSFTQHPEPKYIFKIAYQSTASYTNTVDELVGFSERLQQYLKDISPSSVGLIQHSRSQVRSHFFNYANCSVSYSPCDKASLNTIRSLLLTESNLPVQQFKTAMNEFKIQYGDVQIKSPCSDHVNHPPTVSSSFSVLNISICGLFSFRLPANTFYDTEDGDTRKLNLGIADGNNQPLSRNSWVQLNKTSQTITAFGTANLAAAQISSGYSFILTATDSSSLSASISFKARLNGPIQILKDCQIQILFSAAASESASSNHALVENVFKGLETFFSIRSTEIGLVDFIRHSSTQFTFSWSYCSARYNRYTMIGSLPVSQIDYRGLVTKVLILLFNSDRKTVRASFYSAFKQLTVVSVKTSFSGVCQNIPPVLVSPAKLVLNIDNCGYRNEKLQAGWFYDYEDGDTLNLKLSLLNSANESVGISSWVNIDTVNRHLLISLRDTQRENIQSNFNFYLKATDSGGKSALLEMQLLKVTPTTTRSPMNITFEYSLSKSITKNPYVNESVLLSEITSRLYSLNSGKNIISVRYVGQSAPEETRSFTWTPCSYQSCSTSSVLQTTKQLLQPSKALIQSFKTSYLPDFNFQRAYYISACNVPGLPPAAPDGEIELNVTMCSPLKYKLPTSTFVDIKDGEMSNLKIRLLDNNKSPVSSSSWIRLNSATLELFAIYQSSALPSSSLSESESSYMSVPISKQFYFNLEATNSGGLKTYKKFKVNILDYPYTSDCYTTIRVKRTFGASGISNLDVLYRLVKAISSFYQEQNVNIKVHKFERLSQLSYSLVFSNCSFVFSTMKAAKWGLNEAHRASIAAIFSKIIQSNGAATRSFMTSLLSSGFTLEAVNVSYSCIEEAPRAKIHLLRPYAFLCREYNDPLSNDLFTDARDGMNLALTLRYKNGNVVSPNEWIQLDPIKKIVYGSVSIMVKRNIPSYLGYSYLLVATDSSGRSANISYTVKIANAAPVQDVSFVFGFKSIFTVYSKTTEIFLNVTRKIAKYLDNNDVGRDVVIYSYDPINLVTFELCQLKCIPSVMTPILQKLQKEIYKPLPSDSFKAAMGPEITPHYILVNGPKCVESTTVTIVVNYVLTANRPMCGFFNYSIPANALSNALGETTRDFLLTLYTNQNKEIGLDSMIHFHQDLQAIHGIPVFTKIASSLTYILTASSVRSKASPTSSNIRLNFPEYATYSKFKSRLCTFTANLITNMNPALTDTYFLHIFMTKMSNFFRSDIQQIQIVSYTRSLAYPVKLSITFSNCSWLYLLQSQSTIATYYKLVDTTLHSMFQYSGSTIVGVSAKLRSALHPDFAIISIVSNSTTCTQPPDKPPRPKELKPITAAPCGEFNYVIPADLFSDEDGNTRKLKLEVLQQDGSQLPSDSWIVFNNVTQTISGLPLNKTLINQPQGGYRYKIKAADKLGQIVFVSLVIKVDGKPYPNHNYIALNLFYSNTVKSKYQMDHILAFTRKVSSYIDDNLNQFRVMSLTLTPLTISMSLTNCTPCDPLAVLKYFAIMITQPIFNAYMAPEFPLAYAFKFDGKCSPGDDSYNKITNGDTYNVTFCNVTKLDFLKLNGLNKLPQDTKIIVRDSNLQPLPLNSWFWFNESSSILEAFPSEAAWSQQGANGTHFSWSTASISTGERTGSFLGSALRIIGSPPSSSLQYTLTFTSSLSSSNIDAFFVSLAFNSLYSYLKREDLQFVSMSRAQPNTYVLQFKICGLPADCSNPSVKTLDNKIFASPGILRTEFKRTFPAELTVISMSDNCKDNPPEILMQNLNLTIPICGIYRYKLPQNFATDKEDGNTAKLSISLRMADNTILPRDSWIRFNQTSKEIYALPPESVTRTQLRTGWSYLFVVKDKGGKQATTPLKIYVKQDETVYYKLSLSFRTVNTDINIPYLDIQVKFISMISGYLLDSSLSKYRVLSFTKTVTNGPRSETFFIQLGNCSVENAMCANAATHLQNSHNDLYATYNNRKSRFYKYLEDSYIISSMKNDSLYQIDKAPKLINSISAIKLGACGMFVSEIPSGTFYDEEQGTNLITSMTFENGSKPDTGYWIQLVNKKLCVVPLGDTKGGTYRMVITATDKCNQSSSTSVTVDFTSNSFVASQYEFQLASIANLTMPLIYFASQLKEALKAYFADSRYLTRVASYVRDGSNLSLRWSNCTFVCDEKTINEMRSKIFLAYNIVNPTFLSLLNFNVTSITDIRSGNCTPPKSTPPVANRSIFIQVPLCSKLNFSVPLDTFYDREDGNTRNLKLSFLTQTKIAVNLQSWVQVDQNTQTIYGYPRFDGNRPFQRTFNYLLAASDKEGYSTTTPVSISITGSLPTISYKLTVSGTTTLSSSLPRVNHEIRLITGIGNYFNDFAINDISYSLTSNQYRFTWNFCSMSTVSCDCFRIQEIRTRLASIQNLQQHIGNEFRINSHAEEQLVGVCLNTQKPELREDLNEVTFTSGQYFSHVIKDDKFFDFEDGYTRNLTLFMADSNNVKLSNSYWIKTQNYKICGLLTLDDAQRMKWVSKSSKEYKTIAKDSCGKQTTDSFIVRTNKIASTLSYKITIFLRESFGKNCTELDIFFQKISSYIDTPISYIFIYNYTIYNETRNSSAIVWGLRNITEENCSNRTTKIIREKFLYGNGTVKSSFYDHMKPQFEVIDVSDENSAACANKTIVPIPPTKDGDFPWWIIILIIILILLLLLCWLCWICVPRCCPAGCISLCGGCCAKCCGKCCLPGGKYASLDEDGVAGLPKDPEQSKTDARDGDGDEDETMMFPPPYLVPDDPKGRNLGFERDGPEEEPEDGPDEDGPGDSPVNKGDASGDESSGFREDVGDRSDYDANAESADFGVIEQEIQLEAVQMTEQTPSALNLPGVPSLYSASKSERQSSLEEDDFFADVLAEARRGSEDANVFQQKRGLENEGDDRARSEFAAERALDDDSTYEDTRAMGQTSYENLYSRTNDFRQEGSELYNSTHDLQGKSLKEWEGLDSEEEVISNGHVVERNDYERNNELSTFDRQGRETVRENFESQEVIQSKITENSLLQEDHAEYSSLRVPNEPLDQRQLPDIPHSDETQRAKDRDFSQEESFKSYREIRRSSHSTTQNVNEFENSFQTKDNLSLPITNMRKVNVTRQVELTLPRSTFEALQAQGYDEGSFQRGNFERRKSIPVVVDGPNGKELKEIRLNNVQSSNSSLKTSRPNSSILLPVTPISTNNNFSDSSLLEVGERGYRRGQTTVNDDALRLLRSGRPSSSLVFSNSDDSQQTTRLPVPPITTHDRFSELNRLEFADRASAGESRLSEGRNNYQDRRAISHGERHQQQYGNGDVRENRVESFRDGPATAFRRKSASREDAIYPGDSKADINRNSFSRSEFQESTEVQSGGIRTSEFKRFESNGDYNGGNMYSEEFLYDNDDDVGIQLRANRGRTGIRERSQNERGWVIEESSRQAPERSEDGMEMQTRTIQRTFVNKAFEGDSYA